MQERRFVRLFLLAPTLVVLYFVFRIFQPFLLPISLAAVLVTLSYPIFDWTRWKLKGRDSWAAFLSCVGITLMIIVPFVLLSVMLAGEVNLVYREFERSVESGELERFMDVQAYRFLEPVVNWIDPYVDLKEIDLMGSLASALQQISLFFLRQSTAILSGLFQVITGFLIMLVTMFFLFRDGSRLMNELKTWTPLSEEYERIIIQKFREITRATVFGSLLTALAQGAGAGLVFWVLGVPNPLFWGTLSALFSLVPFVGTGIVWVPWAIYLFSTGSIGKGIVLVLLSVLFVGMIDNVLRPLFIRGRTKLHTLLVFFAIMGGIGYFGIVGMIFGPILVALALTFLELYKIEFRQELIKP